MLLFYMPSHATESAHVTDTGCGVPIRCGVGRLLDEFIVIKSDTEKWESKMTDSEKRVLTCHLVTAAHDEDLKNYVICASCFT